MTTSDGATRVIVTTAETQIPNQPDWDGVTVVNEDSQYSIDISSDPNFPSTTSFTLGPSLTYSNNGTNAVFARITPNQQNDPQTINALVMPGTNVASPLPLVTTSIAGATPIGFEQTIEITDGGFQTVVEGYTSLQNIRVIATAVTTAGVVVVQTSSSEELDGGYLAEVGDDFLWRGSLNEVGTISVQTEAPPGFSGTLFVVGSGTL